MSVKRAEITDVCSTMSVTRLYCFLEIQTSTDIHTDIYRHITDIAPNVSH